MDYPWKNGWDDLFEGRDGRGRAVETLRKMCFSLRTLAAAAPAGNAGNAADVADTGPGPRAAAVAVGGIGPAGNELDGVLTGSDPKLLRRYQGSYRSECHCYCDPEQKLACWRLKHRLQRDAWHRHSPTPQDLYLVKDCGQRRMLHALFLQGFPRVGGGETWAENQRDRANLMTQASTPLLPTTVDDFPAENPHSSFESRRISAAAF